MRTSTLIQSVQAPARFFTHRGRSKLNLSIYPCKTKFLQNFFVRFISFRNLFFELLKDFLSLLIDFEHGTLKFLFYEKNFVFYLNFFLLRIVFHFFKGNFANSPFSEIVKKCVAGTVIIKFSALYEKLSRLTNLL